MTSALIVWLPLEFVRGAALPPLLRITLSLASVP